MVKSASYIPFYYVFLGSKHLIIYNKGCSHQSRRLHPRSIIRYQFYKIWITKRQGHIKNLIIWTQIQSIIHFIWPWFILKESNCIYNILKPKPTSFALWESEPYTFSNPYLSISLLRNPDGYISLQYSFLNPAVLYSMPYPFSFKLFTKVSNNSSFLYSHGYTLLKILTRAGWPILLGLNPWKSILIDLINVS